jgi:adenylate cyclase
MNSIIKYFILVFLISTTIIGINYKYPNHLQYINNKVLDIFFNSRDNITLGSNVVIVDIDDKSLNQIGQWPWSRNTIAKLIKSLNSFSPSCVGFGIIFSEPDRTSPSNLIQDSNKELENYDETLATVIEDSDVPIILGYSFLDTPNEQENHETPYVPAVFKNNIKNKDLEFYEASSALLNIPIIQDSAYSSGFLNSISDENGRIVYMPLIMKYKEQFFPSLALELIRTIYSSREVKINHTKNGDNISFSTVKIPINDTGSMFVNYINPKEKFKHISAVDILDKNFNNFLINDVSGKIILIGSTANGISLSTPTPFNTNISSIDLQANVIENILTNKFIVTPQWIDIFQYSATIILALIIVSSIFFSSTTANIIISMTGVISSYFVLKYMFDTDGYMIDSTYIIETILLSLVTSVIAILLKNKSDMTNIKGQFASKVSKQVMEDLLDTSNKKGDKSSKRKYITIFFSDIKSFTKITEKIDDPNLLTIFINRYMDAMTKNIMINTGGTVDKFMGDAIMAYWNAPYDVENHEDKAVTSAIEQIALLEDINMLNIEENMPIINIRIGINTGEAFVGEVGGELRSDYTVMGKSVNHAAVLEQVGKYYNADIIISQSVKEGLKDEYTLLLIDIIKVDGTSDAFNIYQVFNKGLPNEFVQEEIEQFEKAVMMYRDAKFDEAILIFRNLYTNDDLLNKKLCKIYIDRCQINAIAILGGEFDYVQSINKSIISNS